MKILKSQLNRDLSVHNDFIYSKNSTSENIVYWICQDRYCPGKLTTVLAYENAKEENMTFPHNHRPVPDKIEAPRLVNSNIEKQLFRQWPHREIFRKFLVVSDRVVMG